MCVLFAVLALIASIVGTILFGIIGGCVTAIFGVLAIVFAIKKKKSEEGGGTGSLVLAIISMVIGLGITMLFVGASGILKDEAGKVNAPLIEKYADDLKFGVVGFAMAASSDNVDLNELSDQLKVVSDNMN